jgi:hypothetical protein
MITLISILSLFTSIISPLGLNDVKSIDFCELHGAVYIEKENRSLADFIVYKEESEGSARFWVYEEYSRTYADRPGMWYFVQNRGLADFVIYIEEEAGMADFSIFFTETAAFAGCQ